MTLDEHRRGGSTPSVCLVTIHRFPKIGGGEERFLEYFSSYLEKTGIRFVIVSSTVDSDRANVVGIGVKPFRLPALGFTPYLFFFSLMACLRIIILNKRHNFSLIHSIDTGYAGLAGLFASKILDLGFVVHAHCCRARLVTLSLALRSNISRHLISSYEKFESLIDKLVMTHADKVLAVSREIRDYALALGVSAERILVNPVGLDASSLECRESDRQSVLREFGIPPNSFVIGYLGSLARVKGTDMLVEAFALLQKETKDRLFLLIVGEGNKSDLENKVREEKISSVFLTGFRKDIARCLAAMDVFVLPSLSEGCPYSLLEAMTTGKAIVASDIPSIREIVRDEGEALLTDPRDANMLKEKVLRLYTDRTLRRRLGTGARKNAAHYDQHIVFAKIVQLYVNLRRNSYLQSRN